METTLERGKRIAINTLLLYGRTIIIMLIGLFTSRIILQVLGIDDYGVYNVVAGAISMFSLITGSLSNSISRFLTHGLGLSNSKRLSRIFSTSLNIQILLALLVFILTESIGPWLINDKLNIPQESIYAAHWVLQLSIAGFMIGLVSVPYNACIVAHEKMNVFAYMGILEVILKLAFVATLYFLPGNKLIIYSICLFIIPVILQIIYWTYCTRHFPECRFAFVFDKSLLKEIGGFAGWSFFGSAATMFNTQGVNLVINSYFGVALNAARGIVGQVEGAVMQFVNNFTTALNPQIIKSYASGEHDYMNMLICRGAKFSEYLLLLFIIPLEFEAPMVLHLWLGIVPEDAAIFLRLALITTVVTLIGNTGLTSVLATGNIRNYQIVVTLIGCLVFPMTWMAYQFGAPAIATYIIFIIIYFILDIIRLFFMKSLFGFPIKRFVVQTVLPVLYVGILSCIVPLVIYITMSDTISRLILISFSSVIWTSCVIYVVGLDRNERELVRSKVLYKLKQFSGKHK